MVQIFFFGMNTFIIYLLKKMKKCLTVGFKSHLKVQFI